MTIITYANNTLWADTMGIENVGHSDVFNSSPKIFRSPCNRFAYGTSGTVLSGNQTQRMLNLFTMYLNLYYVEDQVPMIPNKIYDDNKATLGETILITKTDLWVITAATGMSMHTDLGSCISLGSGSEYFTAAIILGKTVKQAMQSAMDNSPSCGGELMTITQKSLKPFKIVGAK